jgi:hypothetical protein
MLCILLIFSGSCLKTEVFKQLYYTVDGARIDGDTFILNSDVTLSGVFNAAESPKKTIRYGYYDPEYNDTAQDAFSGLPLDIPAIGPVSITIENYTDFAGYVLNWISLTDYDNSQASYSGLPAWVKDRIAADGITIHLRSNSASPIDVSLRNIHLLRMAFNHQNFATDNVPMEKIYIDAPEDQFMPGWTSRQLILLQIIVHFHPCTSGTT